MTPIAYRADIDGLRAIAVGAVVLFHAQLGQFTGGFVGVDVFFVISGYLITSIIVRELDSDTFSLLSFYERRIRRIFPALLLVIAACLVFGAWRMTPRHYDHLAESTLAAIGFHSNFYFAERAGYFMPSAETMPLLHTWSLGVEEQFYFIAPLLLMLVWRSKKWLVPGFLILLVAAVAGSFWGALSENEKAFYLPHTRAMELMIGMALGLGLVPAVRSMIARQILSAVGLGLIIYATIFYHPAVPFPGAAALVPCLGSALIIHCAGGRDGVSWIGRLLSTAPFVWLGKISYSLYLWHWPLFAFAAYEWGSHLGVTTALVLIAASVVLSVLTYHYVEQPARTSRTILTTQRVYAYGLGGAAVLAGCAGAVAATHGLPARLDPQIASIESKATARGRRSALCEANMRGKQEGPCLIGRLDRAPTVLVWGDSHAWSLAPQFNDIGNELGIAIVMVTRGGCPPLLDSGQQHAFGRKVCQKYPPEIEKILTQGTIKHVIMTARWGGYTGRPTTESFDRTIGTRVTTQVSTEVENAFKATFANTLDRFHRDGIRVTLIAPVPELPVHLPSAMTKALMRHKQLNIDYDFAWFTRRHQMLMGLLSETEKRERVDVVYPHRFFCPGGKCQFVSDGLPLYRDDDHLNVYGGRVLKPSLEKSLAWLKQPLDRQANVPGQ